jgi:glycosyltransferase involved in cell wall biosynthesis
VRVLCLVPYTTLGASNRLRVEQYRPSLKARGIHLELSPFYDESAYRVLYLEGRTVAKARGLLRGLVRRVRDVLRARSYDLVLIHREATPIGPPLVERGLARRGVRYVFDFDDAIFLPAIHPANRRWAWLRPVGRVAETARRASAVIAGNEYLARWARDLNSDVTIIPTPVDTDRHRARPPRAEDGPVVIGWVGSSTTAPYLRLLDDALATLSRRHELVVRVVGGAYAHSHAPVEQIAYQLELEPNDIASFDIGVLPEPDTPWTRGKGAFKALVYMATALPVVASRVGVNPEVVVEGETGFCVDGTAEWVAALDRLATDVALRERLGANGRERVERLFSLRVQAPRLAEVLLRAVGPTAR